MCVDICFRLPSDQKAEKTSFQHKNKLCTSYNVFFWTLLQVLSDWRMQQPDWWQLVKWTWYDKKLNKKKFWGINWI